MLLIYANCALLQCKNEIIQHFPVFRRKISGEAQNKALSFAFTLALPDKFCFTLRIETELLLQKSLTEQTQYLIIVGVRPYTLRLYAQHLLAQHWLMSASFQKR